MKTKVIIIGGGASALFGSIFLARRGFEVVILEKNPKVGKKLAATGNGRCNISNVQLTKRYFFSHHEDWCSTILERFGEKELRMIFKSLGIELIEKGNGRLYPASLQASSVVQILLEEAVYCGVVVRCECEVRKIEHREGRFYIDTSKGEEQSQRVVIATGGIAMKKLGGDGSGYRFAQDLGHSLTPLTPSLVQLTSPDRRLAELAGVKVDVAVSLFVDNLHKNTTMGDLLFTSYGVSGDTILDLSREANSARERGSDTYIVVNLFPNYEKSKMLALLEARKKDLGHWKIERFFDGIVPLKLARFLMEQSGSIKKKPMVAMLEKKDLQGIVHTAQALRIPIDGSLGFEHAEVVAGGVPLNEIDPKTLESKKCKGLYFCGEVLDVDGACGGYNLHWAWASSYRVAQAIQ